MPNQAAASRAFSFTARARGEVSDWRSRLSEPCPRRAVLHRIAVAPRNRPGDFGPKRTTKLVDASRQQLNFVYVLATRGFMQEKRELYEAQTATRGSSAASPRTVVLSLFISPMLLRAVGCLTSNWVSSSGRRWTGAEGAAASNRNPGRRGVTVTLADPPEPPPR